MSHRSARIQRTPSKVAVLSLPYALGAGVPAALSYFLGVGLTGALILACILSALIGSVLLPNLR